MIRFTLLLSLASFYGVVGVHGVAEVRYGDGRIRYRLERENIDAGTSDSSTLSNVLKVQVVNRGNHGALMSWSKKFGSFDDKNVTNQVSNNATGSPSISRQKIRDPVLAVRNTAGSEPIVPPPHDEVAKMARYIVQVANWTSIATISTREPTVGFPCASIAAVSDGPVGKSTGVPYMYVTPLDLSVQDLRVNPRLSLTMTLAQTDYCLNNKFDPEDPRCAHVILTGNFVELVNGTEEAAFAQQAMFSKHGEMASWPADHGFFFAKLDILNILVLDYFGGAKSVAPKDYYKAKLFNSF